MLSAKNKFHGYQWNVNRKNYRVRHTEYLCVRANCRKKIYVVDLQWIITVKKKSTTVH